jgi:hypothetical protein
MNEVFKKMPSGYGMIQTEIMKMKISIQAKAIYCLLASYTGSKDYCFPSISTISTDLMISEKLVYKYLKELKIIGLVIISKLYSDSRNNHKYEINYIEDVENVHIQHVENVHVGTVDNGNVQPVENIPIINNNSINNNSINNTKIKQAKPALLPIYIELAELIYKRHLINNENFLHGENLEKTFNSWGNDIRLLIEKNIKPDEKLTKENDFIRKVELVRNLIIWCQTPGNFWVSNILSGKKLREKFSTLYSQFLRDKKATGRIQSASDDQYREINKDRFKQKELQGDLDLENNLPGGM